MRRLCIKRTAASSADRLRGEDLLCVSCQGGVAAVWGSRTDRKERKQQHTRGQWAVTQDVCQLP
jgi:hypothetical protein